MYSLRSMKVRGIQTRFDEVAQKNAIKKND